ncbi:MAG: hypothetical protein JWM14_875 [Chitinophagaceae bacterium]|nr:hypothetical protein [Chitinophagaceae bacterium]
MTKLTTTLLFLCFLLSCESNKTDQLISQDSLETAGLDSIPKSKVKETVLDTVFNNLEMRALSGYFLCEPTLALEEEQFEGLYVNFEKLNDAFFYLWNSNHQERIEITNDSIHVDSDGIYMTGQNGPMKLEFRGAFLINMDDWSEILPAQTIVMRGSLKYNNVLIKDDIEFVSTEGE